MLNALGLARELGVPTGATMTVTSRNITEILHLVGILGNIGVRQLKLHCLRPVGNSASHPELLITDSAAYADLRERLQAAELAIEVIADEDLSEYGAPEICAPAAGPSEIDRIEADPRGALTMSCKAVGRDSHAFWYDKPTDRIVHRPSPTDELTFAVPDVVYACV